MLSPTEAWLEACTRADTELRWLLAITDGTDTWKCLDGSCDVFKYPEAITDVSTISEDLDPIERTPGVHTLQVDVEDDWIRPLAVNHRVKGMKATLKLGAATLGESDFLTVVAPGPIESLEPDVRGREDSTQISGVWTIEVLDVFSVLERTKIVGAWIGMHHLEVLEDICTRAGLTTSQYDATSLDPSDAANSDIGHWVISRGGAHDYELADNAVKKPESALKLVAEVCRLLNGFFVSREDGKIAFQRFDASKAVDGVWDDDVILPGSFRQLSLDDNVVNRISIAFAKQHGAHEAQTYVADDTASQAAYAYPGTTSRIFAKEFSTPWLECAAALRAAITDSDTSLSIVGTTEVFSGTRGMIPGPQPTEAIVDSGAPAYLLLQNLQTGETEIVKSTSASQAYTKKIKVQDPEDESFTTYSVPGVLTFSSLTRAQFGTTAIAHPVSTAVYDITPLVDLGDALLARLKNGMPMIEVQTDMSQIAYRTGDFIAPVATEYMAYGHDGLDGTTKFEIVGKELNPYAKPPHIKWKLAYAGTVSLTRVATGNHVYRDHDQFSGVCQGRVLTDAGVVSGLKVSKTTVLSATISAGIGSSFPSARSLGESISHTFTALQDTWVTFDTMTAGVTMYNVSVGSAQPEKPATEVTLAKVTTDATEITAIEDLRPLTTLNGDRLHDETVEPGQLSGSILGGGVLNLNATFDKLRLWSW